MTKNEISVPFLDLTACYPSVRGEIMGRFSEIVDNSRFVGSKYVESFEKDFAEFCGTKHAIAVNNGTSALVLSLMVFGVGPGDEVIVPVNTFIATAEAVSLVGAKPVFVDINKDTYLINTDLIEAAVTEDTKAIIPVHLYGQCTDMTKVLAVAKKNNLIVIEDSCQAHGAVSATGDVAGSMGDIAAFSFYPGKNLGAWGEGGAITTNDSRIAQKIRQIRSHGEVKKYDHRVVGGNFRMDEFQGAVLGVKLRYLSDWNKKRRKIAEKYLELLKGSGVVLPVVAEGNEHVWHLFVVHCENRIEVRERLTKRGVATGMHYPVLLHMTDAYKDLGLKIGDFPVSESVNDKIFSLPMFPEMSEGQIKHVADSLLSIVSSI